MSETRTDTPPPRLRPPDADRADAGHSGRHRGVAAPAEDTTTPVQGRHRRGATER
ncbi:hypothetical protein [Streptomyces hypolithicus]